MALAAAVESGWGEALGSPLCRDLGGEASGVGGTDRDAWHRAGGLFGRAERGPRGGPDREWYVPRNAAASSRGEGRCCAGTGCGATEGWGNWVACGGACASSDVGAWGVVTEGPGGGLHEGSWLGWRSRGSALSRSAAFLSARRASRRSHTSGISVWIGGGLTLPCGAASENPPDRGRPFCLRAWHRLALWNWLSGL